MDGIVRRKFEPVKVGDRFGRWLVIGVEPASRRLCQCDCGTVRSIEAGSLRYQSRSCGCRISESASNRSPANKTHGQANPPSKTYSSWRSMLTRCLSPNHRSYKYWGGKGITICERWMKFENFFADMGERPEGMFIERRDNNGNYEPDNCYWATPKQQARNRSTNQFVTINGETKCYADWAVVAGISREAIRRRVNKGITGPRLLEAATR